MRFSEFKTLRNVRKIYNINALEVYHPPNHKLRKLVKDGRSYICDEGRWKGYWQIYPIGIDRFHVYIVCPYCGDIHLHGNAPGHRVSHCLNDNKGYVILPVNQWLCRA